MKSEVDSFQIGPPVLSAPVSDRRREAGWAGCSLAPLGGLLAVGHLVLYLGYLWVLVDNRRQALHDKPAGTLVVYSRPEEMGLTASIPARNRLRGLG